jgi:hypothetical protein
LAAVTSQLPAFSLAAASIARPVPATMPGHMASAMAWLSSRETRKGAVRVLVVLAVLWTVIRFVGLEVAPNGYWMDEAWDSVHIMCLAETGHDGRRHRPADPDRVRLCLDAGPGHVDRRVPFGGGVLDPGHVRRPAGDRLRCAPADPVRAAIGVRAGGG